MFHPCNSAQPPCVQSERNDPPYPRYSTTGIFPNPLTHAESPRTVQVKDPDPERQGHGTDHPRGQQLQGR
jgi:hypothetical protein